MSELLPMETGDMDGAYVAFSSANEMDPSLPDALANRATLLFRRGKWRAACDDMISALALREDASVRCNRGRMLAARRKRREAASYFARALALLGGEAPEIVRHLGACNGRIRGKARSRGRLGKSAASAHSQPVD